MKVILAALATGFGVWLLFNLIGAFIVGAIARAIFPAKDRIGWFNTIFVGFLGGFVGKILFTLLGWPTQFIMGFVASCAGAFVLLFIHHLMVSAKSDSPKA